MSHSKIRTEKICLNCGTEAPDTYCPSCGQINIEPKQSVWHLINHFFSDITHFDGKFFLTVKDLFIKPGFLSREYRIGRRASYLDPIRMYIFTSAFFFLIFFSVFNVKKMNIGENLQTEVQDNRHSGKVNGTADTLTASIDSEEELKPFIKRHTDTAEKSGLKVDLNKTRYQTVEAYDSAQKSKPPAQRDNWLKRKIAIRTIELNQRYKNEHAGLFREMIENFLHNFPKMLFISLPVFALILKLLYYRRKDFYYVDHGIFSIHLYIFSFLIMLVYLAIDQFKNYTGWSWLFYPIAALLIYPFFYYYKAMRRFYGQSRAKTILKYILLFVISFFLQLLIFVSFVAFTVFEA